MPRQDSFSCTINPSAEAQRRATLNAVALGADRLSGDELEYGVRQLTNGGGGTLNRRHVGMSFAGHSPSLQERCAARTSRILERQRTDPGSSAGHEFCMKRGARSAPLGGQ
jgi:hypothetical protein